MILNDNSGISTPLWSHRQPPGGLSDEGEAIYLELVDPVTVVASQRPDTISRGTSAFLARWGVRVRGFEEALTKLLHRLHGRAARTWRVGQVIVFRLVPVRIALNSAAQHLSRTRPPGSDSEAEAEYWRRKVAEAFREFNANPLLDALAAAVVSDYSAQRDAPASAALSSIEGAPGLIKSSQLPRAGTTGEKKTRGKNINARMLKLLEDDRARYDWSARKFAEKLKCSAGMVKETKAWEQIMLFRATRAAERVAATGALYGGRGRFRR